MTVRGTGRGGPGEPEVVVLGTADEAAAAAAARIADALRAAVEARGRADWATTGGSTPGPIYRELATDPHLAAVPWDGVHVWWGDDRFVPRDHPLSNRQPFDSMLLAASAPAGLSGWGEDATDVRLAGAGVPIPVANVHGMPIDAAIEAARPPRDAARAYAEELAAAPLERAASGFPILDVLLLGVGPDGHVLSAFPGSPLFDTSDWVSGVPAPEHVEPHVARVSLNPAFVAAARLPLLVVLGAAKAPVLADVFGPTRDPRRWPAQLARRSGAVWILDAAAAAGLRRGA